MKNPQANCACKRVDSIDCAHERDRFEPDQDQYRKRKCECACHKEMEYDWREDDEWTP